MRGKDGELGVSHSGENLTPQNQNFHLGPLGKEQVLVDLYSIPYFPIFHLQS